MENLMRSLTSPDMRVNVPLKSGPSPYGVRLPFANLFFGCLDVKSRVLTDRDKDLSPY
jgi:hypothetical protein